MALIRRVSRLFTADLHAVLDQIEEPEALLKQAIREMEEELARHAQRIKWLQTEIAATASRASTLRESHDAIDAKLDLCFAAGNDDLARRLTRRKLQTAQLQRRLVETGESLASTLAEEQTSFAERQDQLEGMRQKAELFAASALRDAGERACCDADPWIGDDEIEVAFLREKQARSRS
jgi:phage shock protein A